MSERITDESVGRLIGSSYVQVNRVRNGLRLPGIDAMLRIEQALGWSFQQQGEARARGEYAKEFEAAIARYAAEQKTTAGPESESPAPGP